MARLIYNTVLILVLMGLLSVAIVVVIKVANLLIQWVAAQLGYDVGDFLGWIRSKLPKRKRKRKG